MEDTAAGCFGRGRIDMPGMGFEEVSVIDEIRELYAYDRWANRLILDAASELGADELERDLGSSFSSVRETLAHILAAEWVWLERWRGRSPEAVPDSWNLGTLDELLTKWAEVEDDQAVLLSEMSEADLLRRVAYRNTKGEPFEQPMWQMLRHVVNHSTYHRGQVVTMLRQLGADAPSTDLILFYRRRGG